MLQWRKSRTDWAEAGEDRGDMVSRRSMFPLRRRADGGDAVLLARWTLCGRDENAPLTRVSIIRESSGGESFDKLIAAQNRALQTLSREIVDAVKSHR
jgi:hypothetical protein